MNLQKIATSSFFVGLYNSFNYKEIIDSLFKLNLPIIHIKFYEKNITLYLIPKLSNIKKSKY